MLALRESLEGKYSLRVIDVERDGNCLFRSIQAFMDMRTVPSAGAGGAAIALNHLTIRSATVDFIRSFRTHFAQFLPPGGDEAYLTNMAKDGTWGGEPEIVALTNILQRSIEIYIRNPATNHAHHERTYIPFTPFATLNDAAPIRLLYFNGTGGPVPNHYALLVPCNAGNTRLSDIVVQARTHAFERIIVPESPPVATGPIVESTGPPGTSSTTSFENASTCPTFDGFADCEVEFDELPNFDFEVPKMPFCNVVVVEDDNEDVAPPPAKKTAREGNRKTTTRKGRSYYTAFEDNMAHGHDRLISDVMAKAEVACRTCTCEKCAAVSNHENAFEMFIYNKPTSPAEACLLHKVWVMHRRRR